jgi:hypothetical protein
MNDKKEGLDARKKTAAAMDQRRFSPPQSTMKRLETVRNCTQQLEILRNF